jgi:8-oxo-dGTP pyrophosphatase MutT (NUDIX family)
MNKQIDFPKGVEVITGVIICNKDNKILLTKSPKWSNKWTIPGGHIEPGETIEECALREAKEETGLSVKFVSVLSFKEMIRPANFIRPAHFIGFNCLLEASKDSVKLDNKELIEFKWINPDKALLDDDLNETVIEPLEQYIKYLASRSQK